MTDQPTVLIADDDPGLLQALSIRLKNEGYTVIVATDGYSAVAQAVDHKPDVLVLDVHMPAGNGFTVHERTLKNETLVAIPVIYITGDKSEEAAALASQSGAVAVLHKPFDIDALLAAIVNALSTRVA